MSHGLTKNEMKNFAIYSPARRKRIKQETTTVACNIQYFFRVRMPSFTGTTNRRNNQLSKEAPIRMITRLFGPINIFFKTKNKKRPPEK